MSLNYRRLFYFIFILIPLAVSFQRASRGSRSSVREMTRVDNEDQVDNENEPVPLYELYWAQNTTAHGLSRIANTSKFQRFVWVVALLGKSTKPERRKLV